MDEQDIPSWIPSDWNELRKFAAEKGVSVKGRTKAQIVGDLMKLEEAEKNKQETQESQQEDREESPDTDDGEKTISLTKQDTEEEPDTEGEEEDEQEEQGEPPEEDISEETIDLSKHLPGKSSSSPTRSSSSSEEEDGDKPKGLASIVNDAWGRIWTLDLNPDGTHQGQEVSNIRKNLAGLAEDVGLGQNLKWYYEEEIRSDDQDDPKKALFGSLFLAVIMSASTRPDAVKKLANKAKTNGGES